MKKHLISLFILFAILIPFAAHADDIVMVLQAVAGEEGSTYLYDLACDDNAGTTNVINTGTGGLVATVSTITSSVHSATAYEGTGSFLCDAAADGFQTADNFTYENIEIIFYWRPSNQVGNSLEFIVGNEILGDFEGANNEFILYRINSSDELTFFSCGTAGTVGQQTTNNLNSLADKWYKLELRFNASTSPWSDVSLYFTNITDSGERTLATWASSSIANTSATFNSLLKFGQTGSYRLDALLDHITVEDKD